MISESIRAKQILIAEDDTNLADLYQSILESTFSNIEITLVANGYDAFELIKKSKFDLIITDHKMPKIKGSDLIIMTKENSSSLNKNTPIIFLSTYILEVKKTTLKFSQIIYLMKPFRSESLLSNAKILLFGQPIQKSCEAS